MIVYNDAEDGTRAYYALQEASYEDKHLLGTCLSPRQPLVCRRAPAAGPPLSPGRRSVPTNSNITQVRSLDLRPELHGGYGH